MDIFNVIGSIIIPIVNKFFPDKDKELARQFSLEVTKAIISNDQIKGQLEVNKAEAENPNRKWVTWREFLGYTLVLAVAWQYVANPIITYFAVLIGHPAPITPQFDMLDILYLMCGMLGLDSSALIANRLKGPKK